MRIVNTFPAVVLNPKMQFAGAGPGRSEDPVMTVVPPTLVRVLLTLWLILRPTARRAVHNVTGSEVKKSGASAEMAIISLTEDVPFVSRRSPAAVGSFRPCVNGVLMHGLSTGKVAALFRRLGPSSTLTSLQLQMCEAFGVFFNIQDWHLCTLHRHAEPHRGLEISVLNMIVMGCPR